MAAGPQRPWRAQKEPLLDGHIQASISRGKDPVTLHFAELVEDELHPGQAMTAEHAAEFKQALYRAARRQGVALVTTIERRPDGSHQVRFKAVDKSAARAYMIAKYGPDRTQWPYNPRTPRKAA